MENKNRNDLTRSGNAGTAGTGERVVSAAAGGALVAYGIRHGGVAGTLIALLGGGILYRGASGSPLLPDSVSLRSGEGRHNSPYGRGTFSGLIHVTRAVTIDKPAEELYRYWKNFENLPNFMKHLESVKKLDGDRSHWKARAPLGMTVEWDAELSSDVENKRIGWRSLQGSDIANSGVVEFKETPGRGTEVKVNMTYEAPGGKLGEWVAWLFGEEPSLQVTEDLRRFKRLMETGQIITVEGQTSGREPETPKSFTAGA